MDIYFTDFLIGTELFIVYFCLLHLIKVCTVSMFEYR